VRELVLTSASEGWAATFQSTELLLHLQGDSFTPTISPLGSGRVIGIAGIQNKVWVCGDEGLIARWGENWMDADEGSPRPSQMGFTTFWPNPTNGRITINPGGTAIGSILYLTDTNGRLAMHFRITNPTELQSLDLSRLPAGIYWPMIDDMNRRIRPIVLLK
jgi:hypothetical protein